MIFKLSLPSPHATFNEKRSLNSSALHRIRENRNSDRTDKIAATWATILARREMGELLKAIAADLDMPPMTVKTYVKLARKALKQENLSKETSSAQAADDHRLL